MDKKETIRTIRAFKKILKKGTPEEKQKATDLCTGVMLYADLLQSAAVDLQEIIHRADPSARLLLMGDVKQIARLSNNIVRNIIYTERNIIYTERAKEKRKAI